jgi:hypothetical protein
VGDKNKSLALRTGVQQRAPSWPVVIATTIRLWYARKTGRRSNSRRAIRSSGSGRSGTGQAPRRRGLFALSGLVVALAAALITVIIVLPGSGSGAATEGPVQRAAAGSQSTSGQGAASVVSVALTRAQTADWIAQQVSPDAITACDPAMCRALEDAGLPAGKLLVLQLASTDPLGADVVVATPSIRSEFGARLASVYAPEVIASFGAGATEIDVRSVAPDGAAAFQASQATDLTARIAAGRQLLRNHRIHASTAARADLLAGNADPRLLVSLAALAAQQPRVNIIAFGDPSPGVASALLRSVEIGAASNSKLRPMLSFLQAQQQPYLPAQANLVPVGRGQKVISVQFDAPSPLGLTNGP